MQHPPGYPPPGYPPPPGGYPPGGGGYGPPPGLYGYGPPPVVVYAAPMGWICPVCQRQSSPRVARTVSGAGWAVVIVLAIFCVTLPFCWVGLFIKEERWYCNLCNARVTGR